MAYVVKVVNTSAADAETTVGNAFSVTWNDDLNGLGYGTVRMPNNDTAASLARTPLNEIRIYESDGTTLRFAFVIKTISVTVLGPQEGGSQQIVVSGPGMGARLRRAIVYPEFGLSRTFAQTRLFGLMTPDMNGVVEGAIEPFPFGTQQAPAASIRDALLGFPLDWPDPDAVWLGPRDLEDIGGGVLRHPATSDGPGWGTWYLRREFTASEDYGLCRIFAALDSYGTVWFDGVPVISTGDRTNYVNGLTADVTIDTGPHCLAVKITNFGPALNASADNYSLALLTILQLDDDGFNPNDVLYRTFNSSGTSIWQAFDTADLGDTPGTLSDPPGLNAGQIMNILLAEADARSVGTVDAIDYDDATALNGDEVSATDTAGDSWDTTINNYGWVVGTDYFTVIDGLTAVCDIDWYVSPDRTLSMWQNGRGVDRGQTPDAGATTVTLEVGDDLVTYSIDLDAPTANTLLVRSDLEAVERDDSASVTEFGVLEGLLDLGTTESGSTEAGSAVTDALTRTGQAGSVAQARVHGGSGAEPYVDFDVGDLVVAPDENGFAQDWRVTSISVEQDDANGTPLFDIELTQQTFDAGTPLTVDAIADQSGNEGEAV